MRKNSQPKDFESAIAELESTVSMMENGQLPLDQSIAAYQRGTELLRHCRQILAEVDQKIRILDDQETLQAHSEYE